MPERYEPKDARANSPFKTPRFTKRPGRRRTSPVDVRLTPEEQQIFRKLIRGGPRAAVGRMQAWGVALATKLSEGERIDTDDHYVWLQNRLRGTTPMLLRDAAKVWVAGMRADSPDLDRTGDWHMAVSSALPVIPKFHYGYSVPGRFEGTHDRPFDPVMMPKTYVATLVEELAELVVERDDGVKRRRRQGEKIERFFEGKFETRPDHVPWNSSAAYAIEQIVNLVLFREYYRGRVGTRSDSRYTMVNELGVAVSREIGAVLADTKPQAFERAFDRLGKQVESARKTP